MTLRVRNAWKSKTLVVFQAISKLPKTYSTVLNYLQSCSEFANFMQLDEVCHGDLQCDFFKQEPSSIHQLIYTVIAIAS